MTIYHAFAQWCWQHRPRLIPGWQHGWRMSSVRAAALLVLINAVQPVLAANSLGLPAHWLPPINATLGAAVVLLRLLDQPELRAALDALLGPAPVQTSGNQTHAEAGASKTASATGGETAAPVGPVTVVVHQASGKTYDGTGVAPHKTTQQGAPARPPFDLERALEILRSHDGRGRGRGR